MVHAARNWAPNPRYHPELGAHIPGFEAWESTGSEGPPSPLHRRFRQQLVQIVGISKQADGSNLKIQRNPHHHYVAPHMDRYIAIAINNALNCRMERLLGAVLSRIANSEVSLQK